MKEEMGGVYLGEEKNGSRTHLRPKATSLCTPPQGLFSTFPKQKSLDSFIRVGQAT